VFGSYGWAGGAAKEIEGVLQEAGIDSFRQPLAVQYVPNQTDLKDCYEYGTEFAKVLKVKK
jgi:anaerobic nitric oxide reductase flavorubredoxin